MSVGQDEHRNDKSSPPPEPPRGPATEVVARLCRRLWDDACDYDRPGWPPWWLSLFVVLAVTVLLALVVAPLMRELVSAAGAAAVAAAGWAGAQEYVRIVLDPVRAYLDGHAVALGVDAAALWWTWCTAGVLFWLLSTAGVRAARVGWVLFGVAGVAMAGAGTAGPGRGIAMGICALWWTVLSLLPLRRRRPRPLAYGVEDEDPRPEDDAAAAADLYEVLMRRDRLREPGTVRWTATTDGAHHFTAVSDEGQQVSGWALTGEAAREVLAGVSVPPGSRPLVEWTSAPPLLTDGLRIRYDDYRDGPSIQDFVHGSTATLADLSAAIYRLREQWPSAEDGIRDEIRSRAGVLNRTFPLASGAGSFMPRPASGALGMGVVKVFEWVPVDTVVAGGGAGSWNGFGDHRPAQVGLIIRKLLTADDPGQALAEILTDDGHVHLSRHHGPAGPIHDITVNGTHRTHALRILGLPLVAAEVSIEPLPYRLGLTSASGSDGWGQDRHHGPTVALWRALMERGHLVGRVRGAGFGAFLEPYQVTAPWLLLAPRSAAKISAAYERRYPGALGIPVEAMSGPAAWCQWLLGDPSPRRTMPR